MFYRAWRACMDPTVEQLHSQANRLADKFKKGEGGTYIDEAIILDRQALALCPPGHHKRAASLARVAFHLCDRYSQLGGMKDIEEAIACGREALALRPPGNPDCPTALINLAVYLSTRYEQLGAVEDINEAITFARDALALCAPRHHLRSAALDKVAVYLSIRFRRLGGMGDLDEAITLSRDALALRPPGHPDRSMLLNNVAARLSTRYQQLGRMEDLDEAIVLGRDVLSLHPQGHPLRSTSLNNVGVYLSIRYQRFGRIEDLDEAIGLGRDALMLRPPGHPEHATSLNTVANYLYIRHQQLGGMENLEEAIGLGRVALALRSREHPLRSTSLDNVAGYLFTRYQQLGRMEDLDEAVGLSRDALVLRPPGHPGRSVSLNDVGNYLYNRYKRLGVMEDLDKAIILGRDTLALHPPGHPLRPVSLNNIAGYLSTRHERLVGMGDLDEAIVLGRAALILRPPGHPDRATSLDNVAGHFFTRYHRLGGTEDLDEAIALGREALMLRPPGHPDRARSLNNVAARLSTRYQCIGCMEDLNDAIFLGREALTLRPPGHPPRSVSLNDIAHFLSIRYQQLGGMEDLDEAIILGRDALSLRPTGHPDRSQSLANLTSYLHTLFVWSNQLKIEEELFELCAQMAHVPQIPSSADLYATRTWIRMAEELQHPTTLLAYETSLQLLVYHLAALPSLPQHLHVLKTLTSSLAADAFSACLRYGSPTKAVEFLEQGRGVFWSQLTRLSAPLNEVVVSGAAGKELAGKFTELTFLIRNALESPSTDQHDHVCHLNIELQRVVTAIRKLPGLSRFLLPSLFSDLQQAASEGPIVIVNASTYSCDALVILFDRDPVHISLEITREDVRGLSSELYKLISETKTTDRTKYIAVLLRKVWDKVVSPIVDFLRTFHPLQSRIWWCPTAEFSLLPLHATGRYKNSEKRLADFYISSYTPTLTALIRARRYESLGSVDQGTCFVGIGQANAKGASELHSVGIELANVGQCVDGLATFTRTEGPDSCVSRVVQELHENQWVHLACHGKPNQQHPFESAFALSDGPFTIERIIRCELPNAQFAYLSACHTTVGDEDCPDEMIHLASAMQFAGFCSVIGTMWVVDDGQTTKITSKFYDNMVGELGRLDHTRAAFALHRR